MFRSRFSTSSTPFDQCEHVVMHWLPVILALCIPSVALPRVEPDDDLQKRDCTQSDEILRLITQAKNRNSICAEYMSPGNQTVSVIAGTLPVPTVLVTAAVTTSTHTLRKTQVHTTTVTETALPPPPTIVVYTVDHHEPSIVAITRTSRGTTTTTSTVTSTFTSYTSITTALPPGVGRRPAAFEDFPQPSAVESMPHLIPLLFRRFDPTSTITSACKCLDLPTPTTTVTVTSHVTPPAVTVS